MKIKVTIDNVGPNKMTAEMEVECSLDEAKEIFMSCGRMLATLPNAPAPARTLPAAPPAPTTQPSSDQFVDPLEEDFEPATDKQKRALERVAAKVGKTVEQICHEYGYECAKMSKKTTMNLLQDLNHKNGYENYQKQQRKKASQDEYSDPF